MKVKLANALMLRSDLQKKLARLSKVTLDDCVEVKVARKNAQDGIDDMIENVTQFAPFEFTQEFDHISHQLRLIDATIQMTNWKVSCTIRDDTYKLAEALLMRKELQRKIDLVQTILDLDCWKIVTQRRPASTVASVDDVTARIPKMKLQNIQAEMNSLCRKFRIIDGIIQEANWTTDVALDDSLADE